MHCACEIYTIIRNLPYIDIIWANCVFLLNPDSALSSWIFVLREHCLLRNVLPKFFWVTVHALFFITCLFKYFLPTTIKLTRDSELAMGVFELFYLNKLAFKYVKWWCAIVCPRAWFVWCSPLLTLMCKVL